MKVAFFGSSLISAKWNGAATYYRGILRALAQRGFHCVFFEPNAFDRQRYRDIDDPPWCKVRVWEPTESGALRAIEAARDADLIVKASGVGVQDALLERAVLSLRTARTHVIFWDVDAPATLKRLRDDPNDPFRALVPQYDLVLTYGGGPRVVAGYTAFGAKKCVPIYNAVDPDTHYPVPREQRFAGSMGFLANRLPDREARAKAFFFEVAKRLPTHSFVLGGSGWEDYAFPHNVNYVGHVYTRDHNAFNTSPRAVLNVCRDSMADAGYSPATRVFEAAGAGACLVTDAWEGIEAFLTPGKEVLVARSGDEVIEHIQALDDDRARSIGEAAQRRVLAEHTYTRRADLVCEVLGEHKNLPKLHPLSKKRMRMVFLGLSITSSWGNGHATTYRGLLKELCRRGHDVTFLERDVPWYAENRDLPTPPFGRTHLYRSLAELNAKYRQCVRDADLVVVGSYVPDGRDVADWVFSLARGPVAFYDIDTPVTLAALKEDTCDYLRRDQIPRYALYLSFTGGPILRTITELGAQNAQPLYCSVDPELYVPHPTQLRWNMSYMGTFSADRQPALNRLLLAPARALPQMRFAVAGPLYPTDIEWPANVSHLQHVAPDAHAGFYSSSALALNLTRRDMVRAGYSPSVRLFEAGACACAIASDSWLGIDSFFVPGEEILLVEDTSEVIDLLQSTTARELRRIGENARRRVVTSHTAAVRAATLERYVLALHGQSRLRTA